LKEEIITVKSNIHPKFNTQTKVTCACGNTFETGSTQDTISVELCANCHPFYTGKLRIVDTANLVKKFESRKQSAKDGLKSRKDKRAARRGKRTITNESGDKQVTLKDMLSQLS